MNEKKEEYSMTIKVCFVNPNTDEETEKMAVELILKAVIRQLSMEK